MTDNECGPTTLHSHVDEENDESEEGSHQQEASINHDGDDDQCRENVLLATNDDDDDDDDDNDDDGSSRDETTHHQPRKIHKLSMKKTNDFNESLKQRGVIYVARIPPRMTPTKLKNMLSDYGTVTRVFCQEEDAAKRKRRRKENGGKNSGSKRYVEGWVEYANKQVAKRVASALHQQPMSNVKRNPHHDDLWNLKYLSQFSWSHLTEKVAYERRVREQKLRLETMQAKRETASYKKLLETGVKLDQIEERKRKRNMGTIGAATTTLSSDTGKSGDDRSRRASFQVRPLDDGAHQASNTAILKSLL